MSNLTAIKCNPLILNRLPTNNDGEYNLTTLIIKEGTRYISKDMIKNCNNLEFISLPITIESLEEGAFDCCKKLRILQCDPIFLNYFKNHNITTFLIQEGVKSIYEEYFMGIENIQNLYIPRSVKYIDECTFYHLKKLVILNCDEKWEDEKYFPFSYKIEFGTTIIDRNIYIFLLFSKRKLQ